MTVPKHEADMVAHELKRIGAIKKRSGELDAKTDKLNAVFAVWEQRLEGVNVTAFCNLEGDDVERDGWQLGWTKLGGAWCLVARRLVESCVEVGAVQGGFPDYMYRDPVQLSSAPRFVRLSAIFDFHRLIERMEHHVQWLDDKIEQALRTATV